MTSSEDPRTIIPLWQSLTAPEAADFAGSDPVVILPLAAVEQHGAHLPLSTDLDIGLGLIGEAFRVLSPGLPARVLPPVPMGASREHASIAGTLSLPGTVLGEAVVAAGRAVAATGVRRLVLSNSHGGNQAVLAEAALQLRQEERMLVVTAYYPRFGPPSDVDFPEAEWEHGLHGGAVETSLMLHLHADRVRMDRARREVSLGEELEASDSRIGPRGPVPFAWLAEDLTASGITGDPTLANADAGARLLRHYGQALADVVADTRAFPLDRIR